MLQISPSLIMEGLTWRGLKITQYSQIDALWQFLLSLGFFSLIKFLMYTFFPCAYASIECKTVLNSYVIELIVATNIKEELPEKVALFALHVVIKI